MRILLTGGTGFIGKRLGTELVRRGHKIICLVRDRERAREELPFPAELHSWSSEQTLRDIDAVIHLAGEPVVGERWSIRRKKSIRNSRVETAIDLVNWIKRAHGRKPQVILSASAVGFYGNRGDEWLTESMQPGAGFLSETCQAWEEAVRSAQSLTSRVVCLRFGIVLGREGGVLSKILPYFKRGMGAVIGTGAQWVSWIHIDDLLQYIIFALDNKRVSGARNVVAPGVCTNEEFTKELSQQLRVPALVSIPSFIFRLAMGEMSELLLFSQRVSSKKIQGEGFRFKYPTLRTALGSLFEDVELSRGPLFHEFSMEQWLPCSVEEAYVFLSDPDNLEEILPPDLEFQVLHKSTPMIQEGTSIDYRLIAHGLRMTWKTLVIESKANQKFVTMQEKGPYTFWVHRQTFEPLKGGTLVRNRVIYRMPLGVLGSVIGQKYAGRSIEKAFRYRRKKLLELFGKERPEYNLNAQGW